MNEQQPTYDLYYKQLESSGWEIINNVVADYIEGAGTPTAFRSILLVDHTVLDIPLVGIMFKYSSTRQHLKDQQAQQPTAPQHVPEDQR
jgi:hypothetical protein